MEIIQLTTPAGGLRHTEDYHALKSRVHRFLVDAIDEDDVPVTDWERQQLWDYVWIRVTGYIAENRLAVNRRDLEDLVADLLDELTGCGPIEPLLRDDHITDILVNGAQHVFIEQEGRLQQTGVRFTDDEHVLRVIQRILAPLGRRLDESSPMVDARLADGSRVNAIIPPVALDGPCLSIRKFRREPLRAADLLSYRSLDEHMLGFLHRAVDQRCNLLVSGSTGAGKTTLLNVISQWVGDAERIVSIEDAAELRLHHEHVVRLETRPPNLEGDREITARDLMRNALRMRPDRLILGEVRGVEVLDLLQAMNTGHDGSMGTVHANSPRDALSRIEMLAGFAGFSGSEGTLRHTVASALDLIVHVGRMPDGGRKVTAIEEVTGVVDGQYVTQTLFAYDRARSQFVDGGLKPRNRKFQQNEGVVFARF